MTERKLIALIKNRANIVVIGLMLIAFPFGGCEAISAAPS